MYAKIKDGIPMFVEYILDVDVNSSYDLSTDFNGRLDTYGNKIVCYTEEEKDIAVAGMDKKRFSYKIKEMIWNEKTKQKVIDSSHNTEDGTITLPIVIEGPNQSQIHEAITYQAILPPGCQQVYFIVHWKEGDEWRESAPISVEVIDCLAEKEFQFGSGAHYKIEARYSDLFSGSILLDVVEEIEKTIETLREEKLTSIYNACENGILAGFVSKTTGYQYGFNAYDQMNFTQQYLVLMSDPKIKEFPWKTEDKGIVMHTRADFIGVVADAIGHKNAHIGKYWVLKEKITQATSIPELNELNW